MELQDARVALTGATGFLGRYLLDALTARGAHVVGVVRNPSRVPSLLGRGDVTMRRADLGDREALARGFEGCAAVVSNAALFDVRNRDWAAHTAANIAGTENVLRAARDAGVSRVVHISSVAVYRARLALRPAPLTEDSPQWSEHTPRGRFNAYPVSKALSEQRAWALAKELDLALTTLRPSAIYGAFDPNFTGILRRALTWPVSVLPRGANFPVVYAGDVAEACARALASDGSIGHAYNTAGADVPFERFLEAWVAAGGRAPRVLVPVPAPVRVSYSSARAARELGFTNRDYLAGLLDTFARERLEA